MPADIRVRIAPSPTGYFHVGNARAALFNWLFARKEGGTFILRIEDTDAERHVEDAAIGLQRALQWLQLDWDEGPYFQSERRSLHMAALERLVSAGSVYYCDCTRDDVKARAGERGYDRHCRDRGLGEGPGRALRFRVPDGTTEFVDVVRGDLSFENDTIEDFVVARGDGSPVFQLVNVVDDVDMRISHVIRGDDHLPNVPKQLLLRAALGAGGMDVGDVPVFAHLPQLVNEKRQKLSKRRDQVAVEDFRDQGYLAEAMFNYLCLLGWSPPDGRELFSAEEAVAEFSLDDVVPSPAFFDVKKLRHINGEYIRSLPAARFVSAAGPFVEPGQAPWAPGDFDYLLFEQIAPLVQTRIEVLGDVAPMIEFLFVPDPPLDAAAWEKRVVRHPDAAAILAAAADAYASPDLEWAHADDGAQPLKDALVAIGEAHEQKLGKVQFPVRVAVTGRDVGPPLFESLVVLGRDETVRRLRAATDRLAAPPG